MSDSEGFVVLHRKIIDWDWYTDVNTKSLFLHCILRANHKDKTWHGIQIKRGSFVTSLQKLSEETGMSSRQIRTALDHLVSTGEIIKEANNKFTVISVVNYDQYQEKQSNKSSRQNDKQATSNRQATDTLPTRRATSNRHATDTLPTTNNNNNNGTMKTSGDLCPTGTKSPHGNNGNNASAPDIAPGGESVLTRQPVEPLTFKEWLDYCYIRNADKGEIPDKWFELHHGADLTEKQVVRIREIIRDGH